jgi:hypothetical protein
VLVVVGGSAVAGPAHAVELGAHRHAGSAKEMVRLLDEITGPPTVDVARA